MINKKTAILALAGAAMLSASTQAASVVFLGHFSSTQGSSIDFDGSGGFTFNPSVNNFQIDTGDGAGLLGEITGLFQVGAITINGPISSAPVIGTGSITIHGP